MLHLYEVGQGSFNYSSVQLKLCWFSCPQYAWVRLLNTTFWFTLHSCCFFFFPPLQKLLQAGKTCSHLPAQVRQEAILPASLQAIPSGDRNFYSVREKNQSSGYTSHLQKRALSIHCKQNSRLNLLNLIFALFFFFLPHSNITITPRYQAETPPREACKDLKAEAPAAR